MPHKLNYSTCPNIRLRLFIIILIFINLFLFVMGHSELFSQIQGQNRLNISLIHKNINAQIGGSGFIALKADIPEKSYIYGNPKGPGIGKPTTIDVADTDVFHFKEARFLPPKMYTAPGEKKFVWIYEKGTKFFVPFSVNKNSKIGKHKITISIQALLCDVSSCTLQNFKIESSINITNSGVNLTPINKELLSEYKKSLSATDHIPDQSGITDEDKTLTSKIDRFSPRYLSTNGVSNIIQAILYGLLAGFILNFMPCVLPVISLKIMSFIKHSGQNRKELILLGIIFTLGILTSFLALASLAAFMGYNWGELFQKSIFLITMIAVVFALTLSMFGVYTLNIPSFAGRVSSEQTNQYMDAFLKGLLATLLATPCSGPFLGGTLAWALTQTPIVIFAIFISVGLGMSLPYIVLSVNPALMRFIPKPGDWMVTFERIMAFLLMATTLYLLGILKQELILPTMWFLLFIAIGFWQYGRFGSIDMVRSKKIISMIALFVIVISGYFMSYNFLYSSNDENKVYVEENETEEDFKLSKLFKNRDEGRISIVKFTADWCPNCKLVEKASLYTQKIENIVKEQNIEILTADLTRDNPEAKALLTKLESRSIPFLAVFPASSSFFNPICLRDIYSENDVIKAIKMAKKIKTR